MCLLKGMKQHFCPDILKADTDHMRCCTGILLIFCRPVQTAAALSAVHHRSFQFLYLFYKITAYTVKIFQFILKICIFNFCSFRHSGYSGHILRT